MLSKRKHYNHELNLADLSKEQIAKHSIFQELLMENVINEGFEIIPSPSAGINSMVSNLKRNLLVNEKSLKNDLEYITREVYGSESKTDLDDSEIDHAILDPILTTIREKMNGITNNKIKNINQTNDKSEVIDPEKIYFAAVLKLLDMHLGGVNDLGLKACNEMDQALIGIVNIILDEAITKPLQAEADEDKTLAEKRYAIKPTACRNNKQTSIVKANLFFDKESNTLNLESTIPSYDIFETVHKQLQSFNKYEVARYNLEDSAEMELFNRDDEQVIAQLTGGTECRMELKLDGNAANHFKLVKVSTGNELIFGAVQHGEKISSVEELLKDKRVTLPKKIRFNQEALKKSENEEFKVALNSKAESNEHNKNFYIESKRKCIYLNGELLEYKSEEQVKDELKPFGKSKMEELLFTFGQHQQIMASLFLCTMKGGDCMVALNHHDKKAAKAKIDYHLYSEPDGNAYMRVTFQELFIYNASTMKLVGKLCDETDLIFGFNGDLLEIATNNDAVSRAIEYPKNPLTLKEMTKQAHYIPYSQFNNAPVTSAQVHQEATETKMAKQVKSSNPFDDYADNETKSNNEGIPTTKSQILNLTEEETNHLLEGQEYKTSDKVELDSNSSSNNRNELFEEDHAISKYQRIYNEVYDLGLLQTRKEGEQRRYNVFALPARLIVWIADKVFGKELSFDFETDRYERIKAFMGFPRQGNNWNIVAYALGGFLFTPAKNILKLGQFAFKVIEDAARTVWFNILDNKNVFQSIKEKPAQTIAFGFVYSLLWSIKTLASCIMSPIDSAKAAWKVHPALGVLSVAVSITAYVFLGAYIAPIFAPAVIPKLTAALSSVATWFANFPVLSSFYSAMTSLFGTTAAVVATDALGLSIAVLVARGIKALLSWGVDKYKNKQMLQTLNASELKDDVTSPSNGNGEEKISIQSTDAKVVKVISKAKLDEENSKSSSHSDSDIAPETNENQTLPESDSLANSLDVQFSAPISSSLDQNETLFALNINKLFRNGDPRKGENPTASYPVDPTVGHDNDDDTDDDESDKTTNKTKEGHVAKIIPNKQKPK